MWVGMTTMIVVVRSVRAASWQRLSKNSRLALGASHLGSHPFRTHRGVWDSLRNCQAPAGAENRQYLP